MGKLYNLRLKIEAIIKEKNLDEFKTKGEIGLHATFIIGMIRKDTPDDEQKFMKLWKAAESVLKQKINL